MPHTLTRDLQSVTADLHTVNPLVGVFRFSVLGGIFLSLVALVWTTDQDWVFLGGTAIAGLFYAFWLICTHDMAHRTLTGWNWFDTLMPRLISYPMAWPFGLYAEIHRLHHGWNGVDLRDPERVQWTEEDYRTAHPLVQWYVRHQWQIDIFGLGGVGLILKTFLNGWRFRSLVPRLRRQLWIDSSGILLTQGTCFTLALQHGRGWDYLLFWLILERIIGIVVQTRDHLEHYGCWGKASAGYQITQLYACRNLNVSPLVGWLMGGLNYHGVHHACPNIPFNQLPAAFDRIQTLLQQEDWPPLTLEPGYLKATYDLSRHPSLIGEANPSDSTGRHHRIAV